MAKQKNKLIGLPIYYVDRVNYVEVAYMLRDLLLDNLTNTPINANEADVDIDDLAKYLEEGFQPDALQDFLENDFGKGMVIGSYMEFKLNIAKQEEEQALKEMEGEA